MTNRSIIRVAEVASAIACTAIIVFAILPRYGYAIAAIVAGACIAHAVFTSATDDEIDD